MNLLICLLIKQTKTKIKRDHAGLLGLLKHDIVHTQPRSILLSFLILPQTSRYPQFLLSCTRHWCVTRFFLNTKRDHSHSLLSPSEPKKFCVLIFISEHNKSWWALLSPVSPLIPSKLQWATKVWRGSFLHICKKKHQWSPTIFNVPQGALVSPLGLILHTPRIQHSISVKHS